MLALNQYLLNQLSVLLFEDVGKEYLTCTIFHYLSDTYTGRTRLKVWFGFCLFVADYLLCTHQWSVPNSRWNANGGFLKTVFCVCSKEATEPPPPPPPCTRSGGLAHQFLWAPWGWIHYIFKDNKALSNMGFTNCSLSNTDWDGLMEGGETGRPHSNSRFTVIVVILLSKTLFRPPEWQHMGGGRALGGDTLHSQIKSTPRCSCLLQNHLWQFRS